MASALRRIRVCVVTDPAGVTAWPPDLDAHRFEVCLVDRVEAAVEIARRGLVDAVLGDARLEPVAEAVAQLGLRCVVAAAGATAAAVAAELAAPLPVPRAVGSGTFAAAPLAAPVVWLAPIVSGDHRVVGHRAMAEVDVDAPAGQRANQWELAHARMVAADRSCGLVGPLLVPIDDSTHGRPVWRGPLAALSPRLVLDLPVGLAAPVGDWRWQARVAGCRFAMACDAVAQVPALLAWAPRFVRVLVDRFGDQRAALAETVSLAHRLGATVIAQGADPAAIGRLARLGVDQFCDTDLPREGTR
ncbi:MAG: hypothetical protein R3B06_10870 [Kofleriaceae bacterium]